MAIKKRTNVLEDLANESIQSIDKPKIINNDKLKQYAIRIYSNDYEKLKVHFKNKGLGISSGIRMIIKEYINKST